MLKRVAISVAADEAEVAAARLLELAPAGFEQIDGLGVVVLAAYVGDEEERAIRASFTDVETSAVEAGWENAWRAWHRPVVVAGLWLGPPWLRPAADRDAVVIDPGRAFGTGAHPTTRICVELLATVDRGSLLDVGCGSGVLAIAAARLGFGPIIAVDVDPIAVDATRANAAANGVRLEVDVLDGLAAPLPLTEVAVANILRDPVERLLERLDARVAITSGYLAGERPLAPGWETCAALERDGWAGHVLERAGSV